MKRQHIASGQKSSSRSSNFRTGAPRSLTFALIWFILLFPYFLVVIEISEAASINNFPQDGHEIVPKKDVEQKFDSRHPLNPKYNPEEHFKHYADHRQHNSDTPQERKPHNPWHPNRPTTPTTTTAFVPGKEDRAGNIEVTTTPRPDWDYICSVLCGINEGGLACRCDVLPIG